MASPTNPKLVPCSRNFVKDNPLQLIHQQAKLIDKLREELSRRNNALKVVVFQTSKGGELGTIDNVMGMVEHNSVDDLAVTLVECGKVARATLDGNYEWEEKYSGSSAFTL